MPASLVLLCQGVAWRQAAVVLSFDVRIHQDDPGAKPGRDLTTQSLDKQGDVGAGQIVKQRTGALAGN